MSIIRQNAALDRTFRSHVPEVAAEVTVKIRREVPALGRVGYLDSLIEDAIGHFVDLLAEPELSSDQILQRACEAGAQEAAEGRGPDVLTAAVRLAAGIAIARLTEHAERLGFSIAFSAVGRIAQTAFAYTDRIAEAIVTGHGLQAPSIAEQERNRRRLLDLLLTSASTDLQIKEAAQQAGWRVPHSIAVIVVRPGGPVTGRPLLPPDALSGLHLAEPCAIVPDPDGPQRLSRLGSALRGWTAVIGPTVGVGEAAMSLRWADRTLELVRQGRITGNGVRPVCAAEHLPQLLMALGADLTDLVAADRLAPLALVKAGLRNELEATLLALFECHFRASSVATRLQVHPQTVRYRLRKLQELFGDDLYDPDKQLEMHLLLRARLLRRGAARYPN
ncbi:PucR family transcriptional regulator [Actinomadura opuntiae]|uniref:PucR family transcriptional regulator n=1 Tax=Actinomadura sp. OS1-43 TaxID=604315 RepID=UPI00255AA120|nr:PucR family transcriptional regulator [Actinomadura sp. OS1-43]MDL4821111.1 helix-turn-helix domain-containing protein [Actinomadura sp. OS1-43]